MSPSEIVAAVQSVVGKTPVDLHAPFIEQEDAETVRECAEHEPVGYSYIRHLEHAVADRVGRKYAIAVSSGTAAMHLALLAIGIKPNDTVMMPSLTFAGVAAAVRMCGAEPWFYEYFADLETGIPAIVTDFLGACPVHGNQDIDGASVEDAAAALGAVDDQGIPAGSYKAAGAIVSTISFNNNKIVTTNGGGMVLTDDENVAVLVRHLATTAKKPSMWFYDHDMVGFNYRMSNLGAALAMGQMRRLDDILGEKRRLADRYAEVFGSMIFKVGPSNNWLNAIRVEPRYRDDTLRLLFAAGISSRALYTPLHMSAPYSRFKRDSDMSLSEAAFRSVICLPSGKLP